MQPQIKNLKKVAQRLARAIKKKEKIILYGDADLDGITSVIIAKESIQNLGGDPPLIYFPDRELEGYGITVPALEKLKPYTPALFAAFDCGISNFKEVAHATKMGFEVLLVDHHEVLEKLPDASIVVDPKQKGDKYPFKYFATAGLAFKLAELLLGERMTESLRKNFLELVAIATIADMMPQTDDNEIMIEEGLEYLKSTWRPGIQALFDLNEMHGLDLRQRVSKIITLLNVREFAEGMPGAYRLFVTASSEEANALAKQLVEKSIERKERIKQITEMAEIKATGKEEQLFLFEGDPSWEVTLLGIVAANMVHKHKKPIFLYKKDSQESQGGIRSPEGINVVEAMKHCAKHLVSFGGHAQAAGFKIKTKNLESFRACLLEYFEVL